MTILSKMSTFSELVQEVYAKVLCKIYIEMLSKIFIILILTILAPPIEDSPSPGSSWLLCVLWVLDPPGGHSAAAGTWQCDLRGDIDTTLCLSCLALEMTQRKHLI